MSGPGDGAIDVHTTLAAVTLTFDQEMSTDEGTATLSGGPGVLGPPLWNLMALQVTFPLLEPLAPDTTYRVQFQGFRTIGHRAPTADGYLGDGLLEFTTHPAVAPRPKVESSMPAEGATGVAPSLDTVTVTFDRPMQLDHDQAVLGGCPGASTGVGTWSSDRRTIVFPLVGALPSLAHCRLEGLLAYVDDNGGSVEPGGSLVDGALDFTVAERIPPRLVTSRPEEGATGVDTRIQQISFEFDTAMDPSAGFVTLSGGAGVVGGLSWDDAHRLATLPVLSPLEGRTAYTLTLHGLRDEAGSGLAGPTSISFTAAEAGNGIASIVPADGATGVSRDLHALVLTFSQAMDPASGTWRLHDGAGNDVGFADPPDWSEGAMVLTLVRGASRLAAETTYTLELSHLRTASGQALSGPSGSAIAFTFRTAAASAPRLLAATPAPGATAVPLDLDAFSFTFDAAMAFESARVVVTGGPEGAPAVELDAVRATVSARHQPSDTVTFPRVATNGRTLLPATTYTVTLAAFRGTSGTALDAGPDSPTPGGTFHFTSAPDTTPPTVTLQSATLGDGNPGAFDLYFSEPIRHADVAATLTGARPWPAGIDPPTLGPLRFTDSPGGGTRLSIPVSSGLRGFRGPLVPGVVFTLSVTGLQDLAGNRLGTTGTHTSDVTVPGETTRPYIATSLPEWGGTLDGHAPAPVVLTFSRSMHGGDGDIRAPVLTAGSSAYAFGPPVWSDQNTRATFPVTVTGSPGGPSSLRLRLFTGVGTNYRDAGTLSLLNYATDDSAWEVGCFYNEELLVEAAW